MITIATIALSKNASNEQKYRRASSTQNCFVFVSYISVAPLSHSLSPSSHLSFSTLVSNGLSTTSQGRKSHPLSHRLTLAFTHHSSFALGFFPPLIGSSAWHVCWAVRFITLIIIMLPPTHVALIGAPSLSLSSICIQQMLLSSLTCTITTLTCCLSRDRFDSRYTSFSFACSEHSQTNKQTTTRCLCFC